MAIVAAIFCALMMFVGPFAPRLATSVAAGPSSVTIPIARSASIDLPVELPPIEGPAGRPLVVIDAGHGGHDPGAISPQTGTREKDVTLALALEIRKQILASGRVRVALTRSQDRFIDLRDRSGIARRLGAGLFISVHADAAPRNDNARGASVYTLSEVASDREAALLAARENSQSLAVGEGVDQGADINMILIDLAQRESMDMSSNFARLLRREATSFFPFRPDYHQFASFVVLKAPDVPSILFEAGYLTNSQDVAYISSEEGRQQIATGMRRAIEAHFARRTLASQRT
jgi:N-acetylmuramoyl-L-alanine amidase